MLLTCCDRPHQASSSTYRHGEKSSSVLIKTAVVSESAKNECHFAVLTIVLACYSGSIDHNELGNALRSFGYGLSPRLLHIVSQKYSEWSNGNARAMSGDCLTQKISNATLRSCNVSRLVDFISISPCRWHGSTIGHHL